MEGDLKQHLLCLPIDHSQVLPFVSVCKPRLSGVKAEELDLYSKAILVSEMQIFIAFAYVHES